MEFDLDSAMTMDVQVDKEGINTQPFDINSAMENDEPKPQRTRPISQALRWITKLGPIEQVRTAVYLLQNENKIPKKEKGEGFIEHRKKFNDFLNMREKEIVKEGVLRQLQVPMTLAIGAQGYKAPIQTLKILGGFTALDFVFNSNEFIEEHYPDTHPLIKDIAEIADLIFKGSIIGGALKAGPKVKANIKAYVKRSIDSFKKAKPAKVEPKQLKSIIESDKMTVGEKKEVLDTLGIKEDVADLSIQEDLSVKVPAEKVIELMEKPVWDKAKDVFYHGSSKAEKIKSEGALKPSESGELGPGVYLSKDKNVSGKFLGESFSDFDSGKAGIVEFSSKGFKMKEISQKEYFNKKKVIAEKLISEGKVTGKSAWDQAADIVKNDFIKEGYDGIYAKDTNQGVIFPESASKIKILPDAELSPPRLAERVEEKAIEKGLTDSFGEIPGMAKVNMAEQAAKARKLLKESPDDAVDIAMGFKNPPEGLESISLFMAVKEKAVTDGDVSLLRDLALRSEVPGKLRKFGQEIVLARDTDPQSPVKAMREIADIRAEKASKKTYKKQAARDVKKMKDSIKKEAPKPKDWESFIRSLEC